MRMKLLILRIRYRNTEKEERCCTGILTVGGVVDEMKEVDMFKYSLLKVVEKGGKEHEA